jgi:hypothetical protein
MRQRVIRLTDDKNFSRLVAAAARYQNLQTVPRVKRIEDPPLSLLIPGSMSLPRPAPARPTWRSRSRGAVSAPDREAASSTPSISSTG